MDEVLGFPPFLSLLIAGLLVPFVPKLARQGLLVLAPIGALLASVMVRADQSFSFTILNIAPVNFLALQDYAPLFGVAFSLVVLAAGIFGINTAKRGEASAALIAAAAALGVVFAGDMISFFLFWELLAVASAYLIFTGGFKHSAGAAQRYLILHIIGGAVLLAGIAAVMVDSGTAAFPVLELSLPFPAATDLTAWAPWLIITGILINLAAPPFSAWLPDSYPEASPFGMIVLSALTTKCALFMLLELFAGNTLLLWMGFAMIIYGTFFSFMQNDIRRMLCYSIIAQVGVMTVAVGIGTEEALLGAAVLAFGHIAYKALLATAAGAVMQQTGKRRFTDLGGLWRVMPVVFIATIIGSLGMAGIPLTGAFIGKSLVHNAVDSLGVTYLSVLFTGTIAVALYLIFPWFIFMGEKKDIAIKPLSLEASIALGVLSLFVLVPGFYPAAINPLLPAPLTHSGYDAPHLVHALELAAFGALGFFLMLPWVKQKKGITLDIDWVYRVLLTHLLQLGNRFLHHVEILCRNVWQILSRRGSSALGRAFAPAGIVADAWPIGITMLIATILLCIFLLLYY